MKETAFLPGNRMNTLIDTCLSLRSLIVSYTPTIIKLFRTNIPFLTLSCLMMKNGQTYLKNLVACAPQDF